VTNVDFDKGSDAYSKTMSQNKTKQNKKAKEKIKFKLNAEAQVCSPATTWEAEEVGTARPWSSRPPAQRNKTVSPK
jgi:hypothetical protein